MTSKNHDNDNLVKWQANIGDIATTSFCVLPWIHVSTRTNGDMRVCCVANSGGAGTENSTRGVIKDNKGMPTNLGSVPLEQAWNQQYLKDIRVTMLNGDKPSSCERCYKEESQGMVSKRVWETLTWHKKGTDITNLIDSTQVDGSLPFKPKYLDLRLGNTCNLGCIMCSSHDSSYWYRDHEQTYDKFKSIAIIDERKFRKETYDNKWWDRGEFWQTVEEQIPNLEHIAFAGGEPLLIKQHRQLLKTIIETGHNNHIELRYTTNGTILDDELLELWSHFNHVHVTVSMDALDQRLHYIRYPIDPQVLYDNLQKLDNTDNNITVNLAVAVQALNILHIPDFIKWKVKQQYKKINMGTNPTSGYQEGGGLMIPNLVWTPTWFNIQVLPAELKTQVLKQFKDLEDWLLENYTDSDEFWNVNPYGWQRWKGILNWLMSQDHSSRLPAFREYITAMDQQRQTNFSSVFPELAGIFVD